LTDALTASQIVEIDNYLTAFLPTNALRTITTFTATAAQTTFSVTYTQGLIDVYYNGSCLAQSEYTAINGTSIILATACQVNDIVVVYAYNYSVGAYSGIGGSGTTNFVPKFTGASTLGDSAISDNGTTLSFGRAATFSSADLATDGLGNVNIFTTDAAATGKGGSLAFGGGTTGGTSPYAFAKIEGIYDGSAAYNGAMLFSTNNSGTIAERMRITSTGNVGIGTSTPSKLLDMVGDTFAGIGINDGTNTAVLQWHVSDGFRIVTATAKPLVFFTNNAERMRISSVGKVTIGSTSLAGDDLFNVTNSSATGFGASIQGGSSSSNYSFVVRNYLGTQYFQIRGDGAQFLSSFTYNNTVSDSPRTIYQGSGLGLGGISSVRASKKNIENVSNVDWLYQLNPVTFNYRKKDEDGNYTEETYKDLNYGLIAEDTAHIADFLINYNDKEDGGKEMVGIEYSRLITPLLKAIQELKQELDELKQK
jgi:hypothetical protein